MHTIHLIDRTFDVVVRDTVSMLERGGIVAVPTDTVYGLITDALRTSAVERVRKIKSRSVDQKAFSFFVRNIEMAKRFAVMDARLEKILAAVWPGPTIVVMKSSRRLSKAIDVGTGTIGIRIPKHDFLSAVLEKFSHPVVQTSANITGKEPARSAQEVRTMFQSHMYQPDLVIDAGELPSNPVSTVVDFTNGSNPRILRTGALTIQQLNELLTQWQKPTENFSN